MEHILEHVQYVIIKLHKLIVMDKITNAQLKDVMQKNQQNILIFGKLNGMIQITGNNVKNVK